MTPPSDLDQALDSAVRAQDWVRLAELAFDTSQRLTRALAGMEVLQEELAEGRRLMVTVANGKGRSPGAERQARYRERQRQAVTADVTANVTGVTRDVTPPVTRDAVTPRDASRVTLVKELISKNKDTATTTTAFQGTALEPVLVKESARAESVTRDVSDGVTPVTRDAVTASDASDASVTRDATDPALILSSKLGLDGSKVFKAFIARHGKHGERRFYIDACLEMLEGDNVLPADIVRACRDEETNPIRQLSGLRNFTLAARNQRLAEERARGGGRSASQREEADAEKRFHHTLIATRRAKDDGAEWWQRMLDSSRRVGADVWEYAYKHIAEPVAPATRGAPTLLRDAMKQFAADVIPSEKRRDPASPWYVAPAPEDT